MKIYLVALSTNDSYIIHKAFLSKPKAMKHSKTLNKLHHCDSFWHYDVDELKVED